MQGLPRGRLYRYNPVTRETHLLLRDLWYSNGVAVSADGSYLVISETDRLRLIKYWLTGERVRTCIGVDQSAQPNMLMGQHQVKILSHTQ